MPRTPLLLLVFLAAGLLCAADPQPKPEVPDPFGLGERLALVDYLKETWGLSAPSSASYEQLVTLYWQHAKPAAGAEGSDEAAQAKDRRVRLINELTGKYGVSAPTDADENALRQLLADARAQNAQRAAEVLAADLKPKERNDTLRASDIGNLQARLDRAGSSVRQAQEQIARNEKRRAALIEQNRASAALQPQVDGAVSGALAERNRWKDAANKEMRSSNVVSSTTRNSLTQATEAYNEAVKAANAVAEEQNRKKSEYEQLGIDQERLQAQIASLDKERTELTTRLANVQPVDHSGSGRVTASAGLEARLRSAVVLVVIEKGGSGSGFFISRDGLLVTNAHVIGDGTSAMAAIWDGGAHRAQTMLRLIKKLPDDDLALLRAEGSGDFTYLELGEMYDISRPLLAVGYPLAGGVSRALGTSPSDIVVTSGTLNSVRKKNEQVEWIQHDCRTASGNSGGPLVDSATGLVIGVNTMVIAPDTSGGAGDMLNFAIPAWKVRARFAALLSPER